MPVAAEDHAVRPIPAPGHANQDARSAAGRRHESHMYVPDALLEAIAAQVFEPEPLAVLIKSRKARTCGRYTFVRLNSVDEVAALRVGERTHAAKELDALRLRRPWKRRLVFEQCALGNFVHGEVEKVYFCNFAQCFGNHARKA